MSPLFSTEGLATLRTAWLGLLASLAVALAAGGATLAYRHAEAQGLANARRLLSHAEARLGRAQRDRDGLADGLAAHRALATRGLLDGEDRLSLAGYLRTLQATHRVTALEFDIDPQRPLSVAGLPSESLALFASPLRLTVRALHEGHALAFVEAASAWPRGVLAVTACSLRRLPDAPPGQAVEAACAFEWLTAQPRARAGHAR